MLRKLDANDRSWFLFPRDGKLRQFVIRLTTYSAFNQVVMFLVFANCVTMAIDNPRDPEHSTKAEVSSAPSKQLDMPTQRWASCLGVRWGSKHKGSGRHLNSVLPACILAHPAQVLSGLDLFFTAAFTAEIVLQATARCVGSHQTPGTSSGARISTTRPRP